jgi:hypothetical protein
MFPRERHWSHIAVSAERSFTRGCGCKVRVRAVVVVDVVAKGPRDRTPHYVVLCFKTVDDFLIPERDKNVDHANCNENHDADDDTELQSRMPDGPQIAARGRVSENKQELFRFS